MTTALIITSLAALAVICLGSDKHHESLSGEHDGNHCLFCDTDKDMLMVRNHYVCRSCLHKHDSLRSSSAIWERTAS